LSASPSAPAVFFLSDYGTADEFVGVVHAVLHDLAPLVPVIDLSHQVPPFDVAAGSALLQRSAPFLGAGVVLAVVDPGVGTSRRAVAIETTPAGGPTWLVGPDNGLLVATAELLGGAEAAIALTPEGRAWPGSGRVTEGSGPTFDGRDVFAPAAAHLVRGGDPSVLGPAIDPGSLTPGPDPPTAAVDGGGAGEGWAVTTSVASVDRFGNLQLGIRPRLLEESGLFVGPVEVTVSTGPGPGPGPGPVPARRVVAFGELAEGELGLVADASGRVALVLDRDSAAARLGVTGPGAEVRISLPRRGPG
jgi:S-adenosylmethionine hydrolase